MIPPTIETPRLRLRGHTYGDLDACVLMWSDPVVTHFIGGKPFTPSQTWARLQSYVGHWNLLGYGYWVIEENDGHDFVGEIGFADFKREIAPSMQGVPEIGFALSPAFHGRGYATEAVNAVLEWADTHLPTGRTVCLINPANAASRRVVEKCAYRVFEEGLFNDQPVLFFERFRA